MASSMDTKHDLPEGTVTFIFSGIGDQAELLKALWELKRTLPLDGFDGAVARGKALEVWSTAKQLLAELRE